MPRIIFKTTYVKPSEKVDRTGYLEYIAKRDGVEKNNISVDDKMLINNLQREEYISYIGQRPNVVKEGLHGLFGNEECVNLEKAKEELKNHKGNLWIHIISLSTEDAERLGYTNIESWKKAITNNIYQMSNDMNINPNNLVWYAAFHNQKDHPHVHLVMYSKDPKEGFVTKNAIDTMRSRMAKTIFKDDLINIYQKQTLIRDNLKKVTKDELNNIIRNLNPNDFVNENIDIKMQLLSKKLKEYNGKKVYGYLPKSYKNIVNDIYSELSKNKKIKDIFELWYQEKENTLLTYRDTLPLRSEMIDIKEFKSIRNIIINVANDMVESNDYSMENDNVIPKIKNGKTKKNKTIIKSVDINISEILKNNNYSYDIKGNNNETIQVNPSVKLGYHLSNIIKNRIIENMVGNKMDKKQVKELLKQKEKIGHSEKDSLESEMS